METNNEHNENGVSVENPENGQSTDTVVSVKKKMPKKKKIIIIASAAAAALILIGIGIFLYVWYRHPGWSRDLKDGSLDYARTIELRDEIAVKPDKRILVAYLSNTGNTKRAADAIAEATGADVFEIKPKNAYSDLYKQSNSQIRDGVRPALDGAVENMESYDIVFVGYPIWWHATPAPINSFLEGYDLTNKLIVPFCTSASCPIDETMPTFKDSCSGLAVYGEKRIDSTSEIAAWIDSLKIGV